VKAEGWYRDPFSVHTDRWFSDGRPTSLVRDDGVESHDPPPSAEFPGELIESVPAGAEPSDDLRRADDQGERQTYNAGQAAIDHAAETGSGFPVR
jgi:hypothetical protein